MSQEISAAKPEAKITTTVMEDVPPSQTLYVRNLSEKVKLEGMLYPLPYVDRAPTKFVPALRALWRDLGNKHEKSLQNEGTSLYCVQGPSSGQ